MNTEFVSPRNLSTHPFLVHLSTYESGPKIVQAPSLRVSYQEIRRVKRQTSLGQEMERVGWDTTQLYVRAAAIVEGNADPLDRSVKVPVRRASGMDGQSNGGNVVACTATGVKSVVRRLRQQEADELDRIDAELADLQEQIRQLRSERIAVVKKAWTKGEQMWVNEVEPTDADIRIVRPD